MHVGLLQRTEYKAKPPAIQPISAVDNPQICQKARLCICCLQSDYFYLSTQNSSRTSTGLFAADYVRTCSSFPGGNIFEIRILNLLSK